MNTLVDGSSLTSLGIDFNGDGTMEAFITAATYINFIGPAKIGGSLGVVAGGPYANGGDAAALPYSYVFSSPLPPGGGYFNYGLNGAFDTLGNTAGTAGNFNVVGVERFIGVRFDLSGVIHFGWIGLIRESPLSDAAVTVTGYAYETTPDTGINVGHLPPAGPGVGPGPGPGDRNAVPEPATFGLGMLAMGAAGVAAFKRRRTA